MERDFVRKLNREGVWKKEIKRIEDSYRKIDCGGDIAEG